MHKILAFLKASRSKKGEEGYKENYMPSCHCSEQRKTSNSLYETRFNFCLISKLRSMEFHLLCSGLQ